MVSLNESIINKRKPSRLGVGAVEEPKMNMSNYCKN